MRTQRSWMALVAGAVLAASVSAWAADTVISTFSADTEGWGIVGPAAGPVWEPAGGNPGGCLAAVSSGVGGAWYWRAPEKFLGNRAAFYGSTLSYDIRTNGSQPQGGDDLVLQGRGLTLVYDDPSPQMPMWTRRMVVLTETAGWQKRAAGTRSPVSRAEFRAVLSSLESLEIRGGSGAGMVQGYLDNVGMNVPMWASAATTGPMALLPMALVALVLRRRGSGRSKGRGPGEDA